jgi:RHS repeat-associated protein
VWSGTINGSNNLTGQTAYFYGVNGQLIGTYSLSVNYGAGQYLEFSDPPATQAVYFGGKRVGTTQSGTTTAYWQDRLGSNRNGAVRYYPWGEARGTNPQDTWNYATYWQDSATGLDYADQRYYGNVQGRFMTPDPYQASGNPSNPQSWNRYAYTRGDPVNRFDPSGTDDCPALFADASQPYDPYSSCSGPGGSCPGLDMIMAFEGGPDDATFYAQAAAMGCASAAASEVAQGGGSDPGCTIEVFNRPIEATHGLNIPGLQHGYIVFTDQYGDQFTFEGKKSGKQLTAVDTSNGGTALKKDNPSVDHFDGSISGPEVCDWLAILQGDASAVNSTYIRYHWYGPNSTSVLTYMLDSLPDSSWVSLPFMIGAGSPLPGL